MAQRSVRDLLISTGLYQHPYELRNIFDLVSEESIIGMVYEESIIGMVTEESISLRSASIHLFLPFLFWMHTTSQFINYL